MLTGKGLERMIEVNSAHGGTHLDHLGRALRACGLMPTGGRGLSAPKIDATAAANFLIGICMSGTPLACAQKVASYRMAAASWSGILEGVGGRKPAPEAFAGCETFGEAMEALLGRLVHEAPVHEIRIVAEWPRAEIALTDGRRFFYGFAGFEEGRAAGARVVAIKSTMVIPVSILSQVSVELMEAGENGVTRWVGEP